MSSTEFKYEDGLPDLRPGEPFFFLRAQDVLAPFAVLAYAAQLRAAAAGLEAAPGLECEPCGTTINGDERAARLRGMADNAEQRAAQMIAWQSRQHTKLPD